MEAPTEFMSVTVTDEIAEELPLNVNGTVRENALPYCWLAVPVYQLVMTELTSTLKLVVPLIDVPAAALKLNVAVFKSRGEELAITSTSNPDDVTFRICTLPGVMIGTDAGTLSDSDAPVWPGTVSVNDSCPSTVPGAICGKGVDVAKAGTVTVYVVPGEIVPGKLPDVLENWTAGSI